MSEYKPEDLEREASSTFTDEFYDDSLTGATKTVEVARYSERTQAMLRAGAQAMRDLEAAHERVKELEETIQVQLMLVHKQAEDDGLWFIARTAPEAYLQQELRKLHGAIEANAAALHVKP